MVAIKIKNFFLSLDLRQNVFTMIVVYLFTFFMLKFKFIGTQRLLQEAVAGLTVSFVALSLGAAFGILSGRGSFVGMLSAALTATVTSLFGGTRVQCSGPTGPMTAVSAVIVAFAHDQLLHALPGVNPDHFMNIIFFLTGGLLLLFALLRLGKFITYVPNVVISGFMNGIAIIIWLDQIKQLFGLGGKTALGGPVTVNIAIAALTTALVFSLPNIFKKYLPRYASLLSATFLAIVIMTIAANLFHLPVEHISLSGSLHSFGDAVSLVQTQWPHEWSSAVLLLALPFAFQLSILAYLDTLLTSLVIDKMTKEKTKQNKELMAQGLGALTVAAVGGIPGAQATIRSVLIVKEKATLRLAGVLVGIFALIEMILLQDAINLIPQAVFSGILFKVGYDVFDWLPVRLYLKEWSKKRQAMLQQWFSRHDDEKIFVTNREFLMITGTTLVTIFWDLNTAVGVFTVLFYFHNQLLSRANPMRDLRPVVETEGIED
jgi:SulP family sulfate permease